MVLSEFLLRNHYVQGGWFCPELTCPVLKSLSFISDEGTPYSAPLSWKNFLARWFRSSIMMRMSFTAVTRCFRLLMPAHNTRFTSMGGIDLIITFFINLYDNCCLKILKDKDPVEVAFPTEKEDQHYLLSQATGVV